MSEPPEGRQRSYRLTRSQRILVGLFGLLWTIAGILAVFGSSKELSAAVLLLVGAVFVGMAVLGLIPIRFGVGSWGMELAGTAEAIAEAVGTGREADRDVERATILLPAHVREETRSRVAEYLGFERSVVEALARTVPPNASIRLDQRTPTGWLADAMVTRGKQRAYIEVKMLGETGSRDWRRIAREISIEAQSSRVRFVLVLDRHPPEGDVPIASAVTVVRWTGPDDDRKLGEALGSALTSSGVGTLHEAIELVLRTAKYPMTVQDIHREIEARKLYRSSTGAPVLPSQISARIARYPSRFRRNKDGTIALRGG